MQVFKKSGFSLVEVMIALAIMGAAVVYFMKFQTEQFKGQKTMRNSVAIDTYMSEVRAYLGKPGVCTKSFSGIVLENGVELKAIKRNDGSDKYITGTKITDSNSILKSMSFTKKYIDMENSESLEKLRAEVQLRFLFERKDDNSYGAKQFSKTIELDLILDKDQKIANCAPLGKLSISRIMREAEEKIKEEQVEFDTSGMSKEEKWAMWEKRAKQEAAKDSGVHPTKEVMPSKNVKLGKSDFDKVFKEEMESFIKSSGQNITPEQLQRTIESNPQLLKMLQQVREMHQMNKDLRDEASGR
jgi:prepilin-type N-terminal cleavage/methylation domain-containing protein